MGVGRSRRLSPHLLPKNLPGLGSSYLRSIGVCIVGFVRLWATLVLRGAAGLGTPVFVGACGPTDGGPNDTGAASEDTGGTVGEADTSTSGVTGAGDIASTGTAEDDDTTAETSSDTGTTMDPPELDCLELQWSWTNEDTLGSVASHVVLDGELRVLEHQAGGSVSLRGFDLDGGPTLAPIVVDSGVRVDMAARPSGGLLLATDNGDTSALGVWSSAGELVESAEVSSMGEPISGPLVMAHADGSLVFGGAVESKDRESVLQARNNEGVSWERRGDHDFVLALDGSDSGVTLALLGANPFVEGYDVFVAAYDPLGELVWSIPAGSVSGLFNLSLPSYDFAALGEGAVTLGAFVGLDTETRPAIGELVVSRYDANDRVRTWSTTVPFVDEPSATTNDGGVAVVGEQIVAIGGRTIPTIALLDFDGGVLCSGGLAIPGQDVHIADIQPIDTDTVVIAGSVAPDGDRATSRTWVASLTVSP